MNKYLKDKTIEELIQIIRYAYHDWEIARAAEELVNRLYPEPE